MSRLTMGLIAPALIVALAACPAQQETQVAPKEVAPTAELIWNLPLSTASEEAKARFMEGLEASDMNRLEDARAALDAAIQADPEFAMAHLLRAFNGNSLEDFAHHLKIAGEKSAGASEPERLMVESAQKGFGNDEEGQLALTGKLVDLKPDSPRAWMSHSFAQAALGDHVAARTTAVQVTENWPRFVPAYAALGNSYLFNEPKDFAKAEQYMQKVVELAPNEQGSYDLLGDAYRAQDRLLEARDAYTRASELDSDNGSPLQQRGHVNSFLGEWDQARADYDAAADLSDPQTAANFATWRGLVSVHEGNPESAIAEFEKLFASIDGMGLSAPLTAKIDCVDTIGAIASHHGLFKQADAAMERSRALRAARADQVGRDDYRRNQQATVAYQEGILAARKGDYGKAMAKAQKVMELVAPNTDPEKNEPAHEVMGLAALLQGNYQKAVEHYEQSDPDDVYARYHLGLAYEGAGEAEKAKQVFQKIARHNFNFVGYALVRKDAIAKAG